MFLKIFFNNRPLFLCDSIDPVFRNYIHDDNAIYLDELNAHTIKTIIYEMEQPQIHAGIFLHNDLKELKRAFEKKFTMIQAAGGLVKSEDNRILMIFRRGKWDLPKGKRDTGEKLEHCAVREVEEETGLKNVQLVNPLTITYHTYHEGTRFVLKESHWFGMLAESNQTLTPQTDEDIFDIKWISPEELPSYMKKSFPLIVDILAAAKEKEFIS